jgi:uncharacterized membrane protein
MNVGGKKALAIVIGLSLLACIIIALVPEDASATRVWLTIAFAVAAVSCTLWRVDTGRGMATAFAVISTFLCLFEFMQWAAWYK